MNQVLYIETQRLELIPCSLEVAKMAIAKNAQLLEKLLTAYIPEDWYTADVQGFLPKYVEMLEADPSQLGYGVWLMIRTHDSTLIGDLGFVGKSDDGKCLELGYEVLAAYRNQGYATEAVEVLLNFALMQLGVEKVIVHIPQDNLAAIRVAEKLGMQNLGLVELPNIPGVMMLEWELELAGNGEEE
jgi:[ribosomal protein S5]-alanine N-acetyltransferase